MKIVCIHCDSEHVQEQRGVEDIYHCLDCGKFFEGETFELEYLRDHREKKQHKILLEY